MTDDALSRAARALRETRDGSVGDAPGTRGRVLAMAADRRRRRGRLTAVLIPFAAVLVLSTAWAAVTGRVSRFVDGLLRASPPSASADAVSGPAPPPPLPLPTASASAAPDEVDAGLSVDAPPRRAPPPRASQPIPRSLPSAGAAATAEDDLYGAAHRAHFVSHDPAAALRAWDAYLAAYPRGRFALEARYNRALSLVRLGRVPEAREALTPFADGTLGGYRRREARELIDALDGGAP
jgi:TolA-binding protein